MCACVCVCVRACMCMCLCAVLIISQCKNMLWPHNVFMEKYGTVSLNYPCYPSYLGLGVTHLNYQNIRQSPLTLDRSCVKL